jgi:hypothetical protein
MAKTKKQDIPAALQGLMRPDLPFDDTSLETRNFGDTSHEKAPDYSAQLAELTANMKRMEERNATLERTNMALMGQPQVQQPQFGPTEVDTKGLPDPVTDAEGYARELMNRANTALNNRQAIAKYNQDQQQTIQERVNGIWERFASEHKGYADKQELVEFAASKAMAAAKAQGMDPNKYMFSATPTFFNDVVKNLKSMGINEQEEEQEDEPVTRTAGIAGGLESGGAMSKGKDPDEQRIPTLMEELRGWKEKTGFYA